MRNSQDAACQTPPGDGKLEDDRQSIQFDVQRHESTFGESSEFAKNKKRHLELIKKFPSKKRASPHGN